MIHRIVIHLALLSFGSCGFLHAGDQLQKLRDIPQRTDHQLATFRGSRDGEMLLRYYLFSPEAASGMRNAKFPLVVVLHHAGAERDLASVLTVNPESIGRWLNSEHPCYVLVPWSGGSHWELGDWRKVTPMSASPAPNAAAVLDLTENLTRKLPVDPDRIYLVGQSMGAFGVWDLASRRPDLFAAAIAVCGGGDPAQAQALKKLPIWAFHGNADEIIPVARTRTMAAALKAVEAQNFTYTEYKSATHDQCSEQAFTEPGLADWLFEKSRCGSEESHVLVPDRKQH